MTVERPILISVVQYQAMLEAGAMSIAEVVGKAHDFGVDGVELRRELWPAYKSELPAVRKQVEGLGLLVTFATFSTLFNQEPAAHQLLLEDIESAAALGSPLLRVFPGDVMAAASECWQKARAAVEFAATHGIQLALENFARTPGGTLAEITHILTSIDSPALRANIDIGNYSLHNEDVLEAIKQIGKRAIYAHVKDYAGSPTAAPVGLGQGVLPLADIFAALNRLPQRILLCFEFAGGADPDGRIKNALALMPAYLRR